jgi:hypothetical protein
MKRGAIVRTRPRRRASSTTRHREVVIALSGDEAKRVLVALVEARPDLLREIAALADDGLGAVSTEGVAAEVAGRLLAIGVDDVYARCARAPWGREVYEADAVYDLADEAVRPFVRDIERRIGLDRRAEALAVCKGTLLGLHRVEEKYGDDFVDGHGAEVISSVAASVARTWRRAGGRAHPCPAEEIEALHFFAAQRLSGWEAIVDHALGRRSRRRAR